MQTPETLNAPYFRLTAMLTSDSLVEASKSLLDTIEAKPKLTEKYRLEVKFYDHRAELQLCLDPVLWYDSYLGKMGNTAARKIAQRYIAETRAMVQPENEGYLHPRYQCTKRLTTRDGREDTCDFKFIDSFIITPLIHEQKYILMMRREPYQELLLLPRQHSNNKTEAMCHDFWESILDVKRELNFNLVSFNFGKWETGESRDIYAQECHAHAHLHFDKDAWESMIPIARCYERDWIYTPLSQLNRDSIRKVEQVAGKLLSRKNPSPNYLFMSCLELERDRLQAVQMSLVVDMLDNLGDKIDSLGSSLGGKIDSLGDKIDSLGDKIDSLGDKLGSKLDMVVQKLDENSVNMNNLIQVLTKSLEKK